MLTIINIALPIPADRLFAYTAVDEPDASELIGRRALVPFGKRVLTGVIVGIGEESKEFKLKPVLEILDLKPVFSPAMLELTKWLSEYYFCSWGETLKAALPAGMSPKSILKVQLMNFPDESELNKIEKKSPKRAALINILKEQEGYITVNHLESLLKTGSVAYQLDALEQLGWLKIERMTDKPVAPKYQKAINVKTELLESQEKLKEILDELDKKAVRQSLLLSYACLKQMNEKKPILVSEAISHTKTSHQAVNALLEKRYIEIIDVEIDRNIDTKLTESLATRDESKLELNDEQNYALEQILSAIDKKEFQNFLLHGVTGSGKTLVYIHAILHAISLGKTALLLVPEISLTPQLIDRFAKVFHENIAVLHSRMSEGERYDAWRSINTGKAKIVIGARSAIFAPLKNTGLIIVDEEHEPSYKQEDPVPRYNARDVALIRGKIENAVVVLGSATPSLESMYNAHNGKYRLLDIKQRADGALLPKIEIVNIFDSKKKKSIVGNLSIELLQEIEKRLEKNEGIILFQNRRGFSSYLECPECAYIPMCKNCEVTLTYHKAKEQLRCHYCGYTIHASLACPSCSHSPMLEVGFGTQRIEDDLNEWFKGHDRKPVVARLDLDTTSGKDAHRKILQDFASGKTDILVGTQMVAKGLDFERVTLVGVVNADLQMFHPDFRASERTYQLLTQVAGRAGRSSDKTGEVIIQTKHPDNPALIASVSHSYDMFYSDEIQNRKEALYPPFVRFVLIEFSGKDINKVNRSSENFAKLLPSKTPYVIVLGPVSPLIPKIRNKFRKIIVIKNNKKTDPSGKHLRLILKTAEQTYKDKYSSSSVRMTIDIDSYSGL